MAKKDTKAKAAEKKARAAAKQTKKADKKEKKAKSKGGNADDSDADDVDLEAVLEEYAKQVCNRVLRAFIYFKSTRHSNLDISWMLTDGTASAILEGNRGSV